MTTGENPTPVLVPDPPAPVNVDSVSRPGRYWPVVVLLAAFWAFQFISQKIELSTFARFMARIAASLLVALGFSVWWFLHKRFSRQERFAWFGGTLATLVGAGSLCDPSIGPFGMLFFALPCILTVATVWLLVACKQSLARQRLGLSTALLLVSASFATLRMDGLSGEQQSVVRWRWTPTAEKLYLQQRSEAESPTIPKSSDDENPDQEYSALLQSQPGDWPVFRGPLGNGELRGVEIATNWDAIPPRLIWRQRVGPAWSSMVVVGERLFTQEQRGDVEAVVCLDAATGKEVWVHEDSGRFWEPVSGTGPRATPAFADGRLFTLGAKGLLNCLEAATGRRLWSRNIADESGAALPQWAFCSSPLVTRGLVIVFAGGAGEKQLLAYQAESGAPAWSVAAGQLSYSSPQLVALDGQPQIMLLNDRGLTAVTPDSGAPLWEYSAAIPGAPRAVEVSQVGPGKILVATEAGIGMVLLDVRRDGDKWSATPREPSNNFKPAFSDFVVLNGFVYGFDGAVFACCDIETGKRRWKQGRYGHGQVLLLADQGLLLVLAESGEVILVQASPDRHEERGRFQAIEGKTWNHPAVAHGRLYVRNAEEMACYELAKP